MSPVINLPQQATLISITLGEFLSKELPLRANIIDPWLPEAGLCMVYAIRGIGKTHFALELMMAVAYGQNFLAFRATKPRKVLYLDGEMSAPALQERLARIEARMMPNPEMIEPTIVTPDLQADAMPNLSTGEGQQAIEPFVEEADLIIIDNISTLCGCGNENEAESWSEIQAWALSIKRRGKSVLFIHHAGKNGNQRGTSRREDVLDTVICLKHPTDYEATMGACFELHFEKARGIMGEDVTPLRCELTPTGWKFEPLEISNYDRVVELMNEGMSQTEIAKEIDLSKSQVSKLVKKGKAEGKIRG